MSLPITLPIIIPGWFDPLWFGVFLVIMVELGQITPPVGFNLFVLQGLTGEKLVKLRKLLFRSFVNVHGRFDYLCSARSRLMVTKPGLM